MGTINIGWNSKKFIEFTEFSKTSFSAFKNKYSSQTLGKFSKYVSYNAHTGSNNKRHCIIPELQILIDGLSFGQQGNSVQKQLTLDQGQVS